MRNWSAVALTRNSTCGERVRGRDPLGLEVAQVGDAGGDRDGERVDLAGPGVVQDPGVDGDGAPPVPAGALPDQLAQRAEVGRAARAQGRADGVEAEVAPHRGPVADDVEECPGGAGLVGPRRDDDRGEVEPHVGEHLGGGRPRRHAVLPHVDPHRGDTVLEVVEHGGAGHGRRPGRRAAGGRPTGWSGSRTARPRVNGMAPGRPERTVLAQVEPLRAQAAVEGGDEGLLGAGRVEAVTLGAPLVEHPGDELEPVLPGARIEPCGEGEWVLHG